MRPCRSLALPWPASLWLRLCLLLLLPVLALPAQAELKRLGEGGKQAFLTAEQAFQLESEATPDGVVLHFRVTPGHYLYRERFHFQALSSSLSLEEPEFGSEGEWKQDPAFGRVRVYHQDIDVHLRAKGSGEARITWQGCADAGLCYPPQDQTIAVVNGKVAPALPLAKAASQSLATPETKALTPTPAPTAKPEFPPGFLPSFLQGWGKLGILLTLFAIGLGLSFTPCVLPMLPILSGIIARQHTSSAMRGFLLSLAYVLGMATTYGLTGLLVGAFGASANLPAWFQHPVILIVFSALFVALALSMFGLFELSLPAGLTNRFDELSRKTGGGRYAGAYLMGFFSALVVSPCVSAPLAGVLLYISTTGNAGFGALALAVMALGMGVPLLLLGATEGRVLPKSGAWMERVKIFFGLLLLAVAISLLGRLLPGPLTLLLWAALATVSAIWLGALEPVQPGAGHLWKGLGVLLLLYGAVLIVGAASGNADPLKPLASWNKGSAATGTHTAFKRVKTVAEVDAAVAEAKASGQTVMLDFYADWCVSCKIMESEVFQDARVAPRLQKMLLIQADVTANDAADRALYDRFGIFGPPAMLFFRDGEELKPARLQGELKADAFLRHLDTTVDKGP